MVKKTEKKRTECHCRSKKKETKRNKKHKIWERRKGKAMNENDE